MPAGKAEPQISFAPGYISFNAVYSISCLTGRKRVILYKKQNMIKAKNTYRLTDPAELLCIPLHLFQLFRPGRPVHGD